MHGPDPPLSFPCLGRTILRPTSSTQWLVGLSLGVLMAACGPSVHRPPRTFAQSFDSASQSCSRSPHLCAPQAGEQLPAIPPPLSTAQQAAITFAAAAHVVQIDIEASLYKRITETLVQCADDARSAIMLQHFGNRGPTREECNEQVLYHGQRISRARQLGIEQHAWALDCAQQRLKVLIPGRFSLSPRYRVDPKTKRAQYLSREQVEALLNAGRGAELRGSIEPDVVIHAGSPHQIQAIFDFKFPCVNGGEPQWGEYSEGHPYQDLNQGRVYEQVLGVKPLRVIPRWGIRP